MSRQTPDAMSLYNIFNSGQKFIGTGQIDLPSIQLMTTEVKGPGILGAIDKPIAGMPQAMSMTINWRTVTPDSFQLLKTEQNHIECWGSVQVTDANTSKYVDKQHKVIVRGEFKNLTPGKFAHGETQDRSIEIEVIYYKEEYDGVEHIELDKYNLVYRIDGVDQLAGIRAAIGE